MKKENVFILFSLSILTMSSIAKADFKVGKSLYRVMNKTAGQLYVNPTDSGPWAIPKAKEDLLSLQSTECESSGGSIVAGSTIFNLTFVGNNPNCSPDCRQYTLSVSSVCKY